MADENNQEKRKLNMRQLETALRFFKLKPTQVLPAHAFEDFGEKRYQWIEDFKVNIASLGDNYERNENVEVNISGVYVQQMACGKRGPGGAWEPTEPLRKDFNYTMGGSFPYIS